MSNQVEQASQGLTALGVRRPVLISVINLIILLAGLVSIRAVDVRELPDVDRPVISVRSVYEGASPATMDAEVTAKLEGAIARVSGVERIQSSSEENNMRMRAEFSPDVDLNQAASDVREAVARVERDLPDNLDQLLVIKADADARAILQVLASSTTLSEDALTERVERDIIPALISIPGVADVQLEGAQPRTLRIQIDPAKMAAYQLSIEQVIDPLRTMNFDIPAGSYESTDQELLVRANASTITTESVRAIEIVPEVFVRDIADVYFAPQLAESYSLLNGRPVVSMGLVRQAGANTIEISDLAKAKLEQMNQQFNDVKLSVQTDDSVFIKGALSEVLLTLVFAISVVLLVIGLFLGRLKAVLVPAVTMPVALIGTLAAIWLVGFSVNLLTLLALVLATGLIVDDAIVVLENIQRRRKQGLPAKAAAVLGTRQVFFAVLATTVTLVSVFLPIAFLPGETGRLFREFGMVLSMAVVISTFVALSVCPMLASRILRDDESVNAEPGPVMAKLNHFGQCFSHAYMASLEVVLRHRFIGLAVALCIAVLGALGFQSLNQELLPQEDRGQIVVFMTGPDGASLNYSAEQALAAERILQPFQDEGKITDLFTIVGRWDKNRVYIAAKLADWSERDFSQGELADEINAAVRGLPGAQVRIIQESSLNVGGGGAGFKVAILGSDYDLMALQADRFSQILKDQVPAIEDVRVEYDTSQPELSFDIDRQAAESLGVSVESISQTLRVMVREFELLDLNIQDTAVPVTLSSAKGQINDPGDLLNLFVKNQNGNMVPLSSIIRVTERGIAAELDRHAQRRAIELTLTVPPGTALGSTLQQIQSLALEELPANMDLIPLGEAAQFSEANYDMMITFAVALLIVFLVLAAQFESIGSAVIVMFTVPFGLAAAVFALIVSGQTLNLYSQIGLVLLIGLMTKNAILLVELMDQLRDVGRTVEQAIFEGVRLRLRPVMMTVLSTALGGLPLIFTSGPGAEARQAIGWVIVGGLGLSTILTLYLAPLGYRIIAPYVKPRAHAGDQLREELEQSEELANKDEALV